MAAASQPVAADVSEASSDLTTAPMSSPATSPATAPATQSMTWTTRPVLHPPQSAPGETSTDSNVLVASLASVVGVLSVVVFIYLISRGSKD